MSSSSSSVKSSSTSFKIVLNLSTGINPSPSLSNNLGRNYWFFGINPIKCGGGGSIGPTCHVFPYTHVCMHIHAPIFFLTIPHFDWGSGGNTFGPTKIHRLARKIESWSFLLHFHKGGPLRASETTWKSQIFRPLVGVVLGIWKL